MPGRDAEAVRVKRPLQELREVARRCNVADEIEPIVDRVERDYDELRDVMLRAGLSGVGLAIVFHEVEHGVRALCELIEKGGAQAAIRTRARELARILGGFADLLRKGTRRPNSLNRLVGRAVDINRVRFRKHGVRLDCSALREDDPEIMSSYVFGLALGALNNLLDNAFYWLQVRWPEDNANTSGRAIHISINVDLAEGPAIVVADTGPGLTDDPSELMRPFFSRRPEGMGVGLYYANLVMELGGGVSRFQVRVKPTFRKNSVGLSWLCFCWGAVVMFTPPRFVVVDDKPDHLTAILNAFQALGAPCLGVIYDPEHDLDCQHFRGVRALFVDLHLTESAATTDEIRHFAIIAGILEKNIDPSGGPFILVVWTEHEQVVRELTRYLDESLEPRTSHARPLAIVGLPKAQFINLDTGEPTDEDRANALRRAIEGTVRGQPQLAALMAWEADVLAAAGGTLTALVDLVPDEMRNSTSFAGGLNEILSRLAREAVGRHHVAADPRAAITAALAPILADRIVNQDVSEAAGAIWGQAVTWDGQERLDPPRAGMVNRMLHVAVPTTETIRPGDWGAVVDFPAAWWNDDEMRQRFGTVVPRLLGGEYKIQRNDRDRCLPRLIRIGAACDHAQDRAGPLPYLFGLEIPLDVQRKPDNTGTVRPPASEWSSPILLLDADVGPFVLAVNTRYSMSVSPAMTEGWQPVYRLREQLLMHLISHASGYMARPGIVQF